MYEKLSTSVDCASTYVYIYTVILFICIYMYVIHYKYSVYK